MKVAGGTEEVLDESGTTGYGLSSMISSFPRKRESRVSGEEN
jgi:hypothetical protein